MYLASTSLRAVLSVVTRVVCGPPAGRQHGGIGRADVDMVVSADHTECGRGRGGRGLFGKFICASIYLFPAVLAKAGGQMWWDGRRCGTRSVTMIPIVGTHVSRRLAELCFTAVHPLPVGCGRSFSYCALIWPRWHGRSCSPRRGGHGGIALGLKAWQRFGLMMIIATGFVPFRPMGSLFLFFFGRWRGLTPTSDEIGANRGWSETGNQADANANRALSPELEKRAGATRERRRGFRKRYQKTQNNAKRR